MFPSIPTFVTLSALRIFSLLVPYGTCGQTFFLAPLSTTNVQGDIPCNPSIIELISGQAISEAQVVLQLSSPADWTLYTAPLGSYVWDSCPYLRNVTSTAVSYAHHTGSALRRVFYASRSAVSTELSVVPVSVRPPGCWSDDHAVTAEWLGVSLPFLALPAPEPILTLPAPAKTLTLPAPVVLLTLPAPKPILTLPAPAKILTLPAPAVVLTLPAPAPVLTLPAPAKILTLPAPAVVLTLPAPAPVLTLPAPKVFLTLPAPDSQSIVSSSPSPDASRFDDNLLVHFLGLAWRNIILGGRKFGFTILLHMLVVLQFVGGPRYEVAVDHSVAEDASSKSGLHYTDPFDGFAFNPTWTSTHSRLGGLAPDLFKLADRLLTLEAAASSPIAEYEEDCDGVEELDDSELGSGLDCLDPFDGLDPDALWMPPTRAHLGGLAADLFRLVDPLLADEPTVSSPGNVAYAVEQEEEDATGSEATIDGRDEPGEPVVEHQSEDNNVNAPALEIVQAANQAVDVQVEARQDVVDPLDGNDNRPLGSWADEPLDAQPSSPKLEQLHTLPVNDTMDSPTVAETAVDKQNTRSGRRARAWRDRNSETHGTRSGGNRRGRRNAKRRSDGNGQDSAGSGQAASSEGDNGEDGTRDAKGDSGRNNKTSGGRNTGGGGGGEGSGGGSGASTEIVVEDGEVVEGSNRGTGSQGVDNWREGSGRGGQGDGRRGEAGVRLAPLNTEFLRRLLQDSADAERN